MKRRQAAGELLVAMFEYGLVIGLNRISLLCDSFFLNTALEMKWRVKPLGLPTKYDEGTCIAILFEVSHEVADSTREVRGVRGPVLAYETAPPPYAANDNAKVRIAYTTLGLRTAAPAIQRPGAGGMPGIRP